MAFRSSNTASTTGTTALTGNAPAGVASGDRLYALVTQDSTVGSFTPATDWTSLGTANNTLDGQTSELFEKKNATGSDAYNFVSSGTTSAVILTAAFSGRDTSAAAVVQSTINNSNNATPISVGLTGVTATNLADLLWASQLDQVAGTDVWGYSALTSFTERQDTTNGDFTTASIWTQDAVSAGATGTLTGTATRSSGTSGAAWSGFVVSIPKLAAAPAIDTQPVEQTSSVGSTATFSVSATTSGGTLTYQWQDLISGTWTNIGSATSSGYTTGTLASSDNGRRFRVQVTDDNGTINSAEVYLFLTGLASAGKGREHTAWLSYRSRQAGSRSGRKFLKLRSVARNTTNKDNKDFVAAWNTWWFPVVAASGSTGTLARTNANDTSAASGTTTILSSLSRTNANDTSAASGTTTVLGTLARTNANDTSTATGTTTVVGTIARTNTNDTSAISGTPIVPGTLTATEAPDTFVGAGANLNVGTIARTDSPDSFVGVGTTSVLGAASISEVPDVFVGAGSTGSILSGTINVTEGPDSCVATGGVAILATLSAASANDTLASSGTTTVIGYLARIEAPDVPSISGNVGILGVIGITENGDIFAGAGNITSVGALSVTEAPDVFVGAGIPIPVNSGAIAVTEARDSMSASGNPVIQGTINVTENRDIPSFAGASGTSTSNTSLLGAKIRVKSEASTKLVETT